MKKFWFWLNMIILVGCFSQQPIVNYKPLVNDSQASTIEEIESKTVALTKLDRDGDNSPYCTGVWVSQDKILTAQHCVETYGRFFNNATDEEIQYDAVGINVQYIIKTDVDLSSPQNYPKTVRSGTVIAIDKQSDLALIMVADDSIVHSIANVKNYQVVSNGTKVHIIGHTIGLWWTYFDGVVSTSWTHMKGPDTIMTHVSQISSSTWRGNSGGGAFDSEGNLVGIASWVAPMGPNISFFIHHDELVRFLKKSLKLHMRGVLVVVVHR